MRKVIVSVALGLGLICLGPSTAHAAAHAATKKAPKRTHVARSAKHAKAKSAKRSRHADNGDRKLLTPKWS